MDFPVTALTDSYILEGSSDIAYAICVPNKGGTSAIPEAVNPGTDNYARRAIDRLRDVQIELRKAQVLVSLDRSRQELFTFYRKEDVQKDAKSIFSLLRNVIRKHECHVSTRHSLKTADLLLADQARLHHLFLAAILSTIKSILATDENIVVLDSSQFLLRTLSSAFQPNESPFGFLDRWKLIDLHAQLLPSGRVVAIIGHDDGHSFERFPTAILDHGVAARLSTPRKVLLARTGQYARYNGGYVGKLPALTIREIRTINSRDQRRDLILERAWQLTWRMLVAEWLEETESDFDLDGAWVEAELPICKVDSPQLTAAEESLSERNIFWKRIFWPRCLCFVNSADQLADPMAGSSSGMFDDPLEFIGNWINSAAEREAAATKVKHNAERSKRRSRTEAAGPSQNSVEQTDVGRNPQRVPSLDGQGVANIYPTPPDGALTQVTDSGLAPDSAGATPGEAVCSGQAARPETNVSMMNLMQGHGGIGSGLYDEDLFDDVPAQKLREAEMADEPNWDFFDEPEVGIVESSDNMEVDAPKSADAMAKFQDLASKESSLHSDPINTLKIVAELPRERSQNHDLNIAKGAKGERGKSAGNSKLPSSNEGAGIGDNGSPLSPIDVKKILFVEVEGQDTPLTTHNVTTRSNIRSLTKDHVDENATRPHLRVANSRYRADGQFWFAAADRMHVSTSQTATHDYTIPKVGKPKNEQSLNELRSRSRSENPILSPSEEDSDFDSSDFFSNGDGHSLPDKADYHEEGGSRDSPTSKEDPLDSETAASIKERVTQLVELLRHSGEEEFYNHAHEALQVSPNPTLAVDREALLIVAQVLVDQISQSVFQHAGPRGSAVGLSTRRLDISDRLQHIYGNAVGVDVAKLSETPATAESPPSGYGLTECAASYIRASRSEAQVDALTTIQPFWEMLGLQPTGGKKNITAFCIHPADLHVEEGSAAFMQRLSEVYFNCNLGSHKVGNIDGTTSNGLTNWDARQASGMSTLLEICEELGSSLSALHSWTGNVVVYIVNPFEEMTAFADICNAFVALFRTYASTRRKSSGLELILQILPMSFVASPDTVVIPRQGEYLGLALEIYNRCPSNNTPDRVADSGAAILLAAQVPNKILFNLTSDATSPVAEGGEHLHLAYSQSADLRWVVACWTDDLGKTALTMTYCLRQKGSPSSRPRVEVFRDMWEVSADIMTKAGGQWSLVVARDGPITPSEINEWSFLANQNASNSNRRECLLTLLTFDEHPSLQFSSPPSQSKLQLPTTTAAAAASAMKHGTPGSTPSAMAMGSSPEQVAASTPIPPTPVASGLVTAPTPPDQTAQYQGHGFDGSADPDATLVDPTDDCWSLVLPFGLNNSHSSLESRPALLSGFLLKRRGPTENDGLVALGVNLIHTSVGASRAEHTCLLRELLGTWRGLHTLTKTKGLGEAENILPWHVRTAVTGRRAVAEAL